MILIEFRGNDYLPSKQVLPLQLRERSRQRSPASPGGTRRRKGGSAYRVQSRAWPPPALARPPKAVVDKLERGCALRDENGRSVER